MTNHPALAFPLPAVLSLFLAACSGGSGPSPSGSTGAGREAHIVNDTSGGAGGRLYARVAAIALEDDQGKMTPNLVVGANPEFVISDPVGAAFGLELADFGPGKFLKVHVSFLPNSLMFKKGNDKPAPVILVGGAITAPFASPLDVHATGAYRVQLRHKTQVALVKNAQDQLTWKPDMEASASAPVLLQDAKIEVVGIDLAKGTVEGVIESMTGLKTTLGFLSGAVLVIDGEEKSATDFLSALEVKDVLDVFGLLDGASNTMVAFAERVDPLAATNGNGRKNKVRGTITKAAATGIELELFEIRIGGRDIPRDRPVTLDVDSSAAKIKWVPRYGRHGGHLPPTSLQADMYVEVEWLGDTPNQEVTAHKINIRAHGRFDFLDRIAGTVTAVDTKAGTLTVAGHFDFGNELYESITVSLGADALLVADMEAAASELTLADVGVDDTVWLFCRKQAGANVDGVLVVVDR